MLRSTYSERTGLICLYCLYNGSRLLGTPKEFGRIFSQNNNSNALEIFTVLNHTIIHHIREFYRFWQTNEQNTAIFVRQFFHSVIT